MWNKFLFSKNVSCVKNVPKNKKEAISFSSNEKGDLPNDF